MAATHTCARCGRQLPAFGITSRVLPHDAPGTRLRCGGSMRGGLPLGGTGA